MGKLLVGPSPDEVRYLRSQWCLRQAFRDESLFLQGLLETRPKMSTTHAIPLRLHDTVLIPGTDQLPLAETRRSAFPG